MKFIIKLIFLFFIPSLLYSQVVPIRPVHIMDFSGYSTGKINEGRGGNTPWNWFDGNADPDSHNPSLTDFAYDSAGYYTSVIGWRGMSDPEGTDGLGNKYAGKRGVRILLDLVGDKHYDTLKKVRLTKIYGLQLAPQNDGFKDTLWFYNFDYVFTQPKGERWKYLARPDSLLTPIGYLVSGSSIFWYPTWTKTTFAATDCRYLYVRMHRYVHGVNWVTYPDFREIVFYGERLYSVGDVQFRPTYYTGLMPKPKRLQNIIGSNSIGANASEYFNDGLVRFYQKIEAQYDLVNVPFSNPSRVYNFNFYNFTASQWNSELALRDSGILVHSSIRGCSNYLVQQLGHGEAINVTEPGMEPESPYNYFSDAHFFRSYAKMWGNNQDSSHYAAYRFSNTGQIPGPPVGKNHYYGVEPGNEDEFRGATFLASIMRAVAVWDGYEGRLNDIAGNLGIKSADPNFKVIMPGRVFLDSNYLACFVFTSKLIRDDEVVCFDIANYHHYPRTINFIDHSPIYEEQVGSKARSPEQDRMYERLDKSSRQMYSFLNGDTTKKIYLSEYGSDNFSTPPTTVGQIAFGPPCFCLWTISSVPKLPGLDSIHSKGTLALRFELILSTLSGWSYHEFNMENGGYTGNNNSPQLFATPGRAGDRSGGGTDLDFKFENWWVRASTFRILKNYVFDSLVVKGDSTGAWIIKYIKPGTDSAVYAVWNGTIDGSQTTGIILRFKPLVGNANNYKYSYATSVGTTTLRSVVNNTLTVTAREEPEFYFVQQIPTSILPSYYFLKNNKQAIFKN